MAKILKLIETSFLDYPDNTNLALILVFIGCEHNCLNCHNKQFQQYTDNLKDQVIDLNKDNLEVFIQDLQKLAIRNRTKKIVFSGGDPLYKDNLSIVNDLINKLSKDYDICIYTGYDLGYIKNKLNKGFKFIKSGKYIENLKIKSEKTDEYIQLASKNQKLYDENLNLISINGRYYFNTLK